jgi:lactam utilization protein B
MSGFLRREPIMAQKFEEPPAYRVYFLDGEDKIKKSRPVADCATDEEAIEKVRALTDERKLQLYDGCRLVITLPAKG